MFTFSIIPKDKCIKRGFKAKFEKVYKREAGTLIVLKQRELMEERRDNNCLPQGFLGVALKTFSLLSLSLSLQTLLHKRWDITHIQKGGLICK